MSIYHIYLALGALDSYSWPVPPPGMASRAQNQTLPGNACSGHQSLDLCRQSVHTVYSLGLSTIAPLVLCAGPARLGAHAEASGFGDVTVTHLLSCLPAHAHPPPHLLLLPATRAAPRPCAGCAHFARAGMRSFGHWPIFRACVWGGTASPRLGPAAHARPALCHPAPGGGPALIVRHGAQHTTKPVPAAYPARDWGPGPRADASAWRAVVLQEFYTC